MRPRRTQMPPPLTIHVFVDTNTALHFRRPDQIDWVALTGAQKVVLVASPVLLRELEEQKVHNRSARLRDRADKYIRWLAEHLRNPGRDVRPGVQWHFITTEPLIDFATNGLSSSVMDDHLIASVLTYSPEDGGMVQVATADLPLEVKLRSRMITVLPIPDSDRLPQEPDPAEKEIRELKQQVARLQARFPKLTLLALGGQARFETRLPSTPKAPDPASLAEMRDRHPRIILPNDPKNPTDPLTANLTQLGARINSMDLAARQFPEYNRRLTAFYEAYDQYLTKLAEWASNARLTLTIDLIVANEGTAPASDIDVILSFPSDIILFDIHETPSRPEPPKPPSRPSIFGFGGLGDNMDIQALFELKRPRSQIPEVDDAPTVGGSRVHFHVSSIKHGIPRSLRPFAFRFPDGQAARSFSIKYELSAAELPESVQGRFDLVLLDGVDD